MRRVLLTLAALVPLTLVACGDSTGPSGNLTGTYTLETINGASLPAVTNSGTEITAGFVRLNENGTFTTSHTSRFAQTGSLTTMEIDGTYTRAGNDVVLTFTAPGGSATLVVVGTWDRNRRLTFAGTGEPWVYVR